MVKITFDDTSPPCTPPRGGGKRKKGRRKGKGRREHTSLDISSEIDVLDDTPTEASGEMGTDEVPNGTPPPYSPLRPYPLAPSLSLSPSQSVTMKSDTPAADGDPASAPGAPEPEPGANIAARWVEIATNIVTGVAAIVAVIVVVTRGIADIVAFIVVVQFVLAAVALFLLLGAVVIICVVGMLIAVVGQGVAAAMEEAEGEKGKSKGRGKGKGKGDLAVWHGRV